MTTNTNAAPDLKTVINFLMGECTLNGFQFGETPEGAGKYWWRAELRRAALSAVAQPPIHDGVYPAELRDYFAAAALQGWLASFGVEADHPAVSRCSATVAHQAYVMADAMLAMRESNAEITGG